MPGLFPETRWTLVLAARRDPERRRIALEAVVRPRWKALYVLARKLGLSPSEAEDAVQSFLTRLIEGDLLERLDPGKGRLRAYLKTAFRHHLSNLREAERAQKRGGGRSPEDLADAEALLLAPAPSPDVLFDRAWALKLFQDALSDLEREFTSGERSGPFEILKQLFAFGEAAPYAELARTHGMTVPQLKAFVHRARARFRQLLQARAADTLAGDGGPEDEIRALLQVMAA
jgi:DNA-directed RNA polymerase specialized sigma24 family protein